RPLTQFARQRRRRLTERHAVEHGLPALLHLFQLFPPLLLVLRRVNRVAVTEHLGVSTDQLVDQFPGHIVNIERIVRVRRGKPGMEEYLYRGVAELFPQRRPITGLERVEGFVRFRNEVLSQRIVRLRSAPGTPARRSQPVHHPNSIQQRLRGHDRTVRDRNWYPDTSCSFGAMSISVGSHTPYRGLTRTSRSRATGCSIRSPSRVTNCSSATSE